MSSIHPLVRFLGTLPQFQMFSLDSCAIEMRHGVVVSKYLPESDEPKFRNRLNLRWPNTPFDVVCPVEGEKYVELQILEAVRLGINEGDVRQRAVKATEEGEQWHA